MSNVPRLDFWVIQRQIENYETTRLPLSVLVPQKSVTYAHEAEITALDFLKDELRSLLSDAEARTRYLAELLDSDL